MRTALISVFLLTCFASLNAQEQAGTIVFFRKSHAATSHIKPAVFCDGKELARIDNGTYFQVTAPVGPHNCTAESLQRPAIEVKVIGGQDAYVHVDIRPGFKERAVLANTTKTEYDRQAAQLKPLKEWSRDSLAGVEPESLTPAPVQMTTQTEYKHSGKFGDLAVNVSEFIIFPAQNGRATLEAFVSVTNEGNGVICPNLYPMLNTTFDLQYPGVGIPAPRMREMLPGELAKGTYEFDIKDGVQPLELVFRLGPLGHSIRCGEAANVHDPSIPNEIRLDVRDLPVRTAPPSSSLSTAPSH